MNKENDKLNKFKAESKLKSKKSDLFNSYLEKTNNIRQNCINKIKV